MVLIIHDGWGYFQKFFTLSAFIALTVIDTLREPGHQMAGWLHVKAVRL